ncbi:S8 family serine peptidase [uncultured Muribaculum sp.]|uniref:S8 family serine peptidase n=1 Tax=uncultured Muribaculum sp. TaxID=1918613 RepID=UPI0025FE77DE|nr:S8 family serine peptidase [uncultured Muribaculum sp.]
MKKSLLVMLAFAIGGGCLYAGELDLLSRSELRRLRAERMPARGPVRSPSPLAGKGVANDAVSSKIGAFVRLVDGYSVADLEADGIEVLTCRGDIALCMVPVDSAEMLASRPSVRSMQIARRLHTHMDRSRAAIGLDGVHSGDSGLEQPYTGKGVIAAVVDQGIDPNHVSFLNPDGTTRMGYLYTIDYANNPSGFADDGFWGEEVKNFTTDTPYGYHGTHTLGILGGNYQGDVTMPDASAFVDRDHPVAIVDVPNPFRGAAPGATLAASACADLNDMFIAYGVDQMCSYSFDQKKPMVLSMSLGSNVGPHDESSNMNRFLDLIATKGEDNPNPPILCLSAGNEGDRRICLRKTLNTADDVFQTMIWPSVYQYDPEVEGSVTARQDRIAIYSSDTTRLEVQALLFNKTRNYRVASRMPVIGDGVGAYYLSNDSLRLTTNDKVDNTLAKYFYGSVGLGGMMDTEVNRYYAMIDYGIQNLDNNRDDNYILGFQVKIAPGQKIPEGGVHVECYCSGETSEMYDYGRDGFENGSRNGSVSDMAIGKKLIVVGSYNTRNEWFCLDGYASRYESDNDYFTLGRVSGFSSFGTLRDGRDLPTVCAPGMTVVSSVNRYFTEIKGVDTQAARLYQAKAVGDDGRISYWKQEIGTSMSTPLVAGAIACWLEADPSLTYADVQDIIKSTAVVDDDVRAGDPVQWGAGKFDALAGIKEVIRRKGSSSISGISPDDAAGNLIVTQAGANAYTFFIGGAPSLLAEVYTFGGAKVLSRTVSGDEVTISLDGMQSGIYIVNVNGHARKMIVK